MAVLVPLNNENALDKLGEAGVEELYVGFHDQAWNDQFGADAELNRMSGFGLEANPFGFQHMRRLIQRTTENGMRAYVCFNAPGYTPEQCDFIAKEYLPGIAESGAQGAILSGIALIDRVKHAGLDAVISTMAGVFNERLAAFYQGRGASRVILPRDLSYNEIASIMSEVPGLEYEVFLMRNGCMFSDSHCLGRHRAGAPSLCMSLREAEVSIRPARRADGEALDPEGFMSRAQETERLWDTYFHRRTCGLCALWRFERLGVSAYKVVGRGDDADDLCFDAGLVARNASLARACETEGEYLRKMERPREPETLCGYRGLSCYYPELARW